MTENNCENFSEEIAIDPDALDIELLKQPSLTYKYNTLLAEAKEKMDKAKSELDLISARLNLEIRSSPETFILSNIKITESVYTSTLEVQGEYIGAVVRLNLAKSELGYIQAAIAAIEAKKSALENLVKLNGTNYFSSPSLPRNLGEEMEKKQKQEQRKVSSNLVERMNESKKPGRKK